MTTDPKTAKQQLIASAAYYGWGHEEWANKVIELQAEINRLNHMISKRSGDTSIQLGKWWNKTITKA